MFLSLVYGSRISSDSSDCLFGLFTFTYILIYKYVHYTFPYEMSFLPQNGTAGNLFPNSDIGSATLSQKSQTPNYPVTTQ